MHSRKKIILIVAVFAVVCVVMIIAAIASFVNRTSENQGTVGTQEVTIDETTGESIISTEGKVAESEFSEDVILLGFSDLYSYGLSTIQVTSVQQFIEAYAHDTDNPVITKVSFDNTSSRQKINQNNGEVKITSELVLNGDSSIKRKIEMSYVGTRDMFIVIKDMSGKTIYTSALDAH